MNNKISVYDKDNFFELYQKLRANPISLNEIIEKPTMLSLLPNLKGKKLLDLGCGTGGHLQLYLERGAAKVIGTDFSEKMLEQAEKDLQKCGQFSGRFSLYHLPIEKLAELPESHFDVITSSFAFHYIENFPTLLSTIHDKLSSNGTLIFSQEHPITTCHKEGERWEKNDKKQQVAYRLNHYREEGERNRNWFKQPFQTYHRTTATIINNLIHARFQIEQMEEPMLADQPQWHNEFKDLSHRPPLLFIKARKVEK